MVAAFIGSANKENHMEAAATACIMMKNAGEQAAKSHGMGSFAVALLDALSTMGQ